MFLLIALSVDVDLCHREQLHEAVYKALSIKPSSPGNQGSQLTQRYKRIAFDSHLGHCG
jgi:hypothetical protein